MASQLKSHWGMIEMSQGQTVESRFVQATDGRWIHRESVESYEASLKRAEEVRRQALLRKGEEKLSCLDKAEYGEDIVRHMLDVELQTLPDVDSIDIQSEIQWFMRPFLLNFLVEVQISFGLLPETLHLAINILDRYCSKRTVYRRHYQLVGCTALLIAAKYGECSKKVPQIGDLVKMCCNAYDEHMFMQMEKHVLVTLEWAIGSPTVDGFLQLALDDVSGPFDHELKNMALYISEIALYHRDFVSMRSSDLAKVSLALSRVVLKASHDEWTMDCDPHTMVYLSQHLHRPSKILFNKYMTAPLWSVSLLLEEFLLQQQAQSCPVTAPPTPPREVSVKYDTPSPSKKRKYSESMPNEPLTPPITPESEDVDYITGRVTKRCFAFPAPQMKSLAATTAPPTLPQIRSLPPIASFFRDA